MEARAGKEFETTEIIRTEVSLTETRDSLEHRVQERTSELHSKNLELVKSSNELVASQAQLIHSDRLAAVGELTPGVAHELNQPLSGTRSMLKRASAKQQTRKLFIVMS